MLFVVPVTLLMLFASLLASSAWLMVGNVAPSLDGRFGGAAGRFGPVPYSALADRDLPEDAAVLCSSFVHLDDSRFRIELVTLGGNPQLVEPVSELLTGRRPAAETEIAVSPVVAERAGRTAAEVVSIGTNQLQVVGTAVNPDQTSEPIAYTTLDATPEQAVCYVLGNSANNIAGALGSDTINVAWWPRANEAVSNSLRVVIGVLALLVGLCSTALVMTGLFVLGEELRPEFSTLFAIGVEPAELRRATSGVVAVIGFALGGLGFVLGIGVERLSRTLVAELADITPGGGVGSVTAAVVGIVIAGLFVSVAAVAGSLIPIKRSVSNSLVQQMAGDVGGGEDRSSLVVPAVAGVLLTIGVAGAVATAKPGSLAPLFVFALMVLVGGLASIDGFLLVGSE
ncbi:MAG: hypothetical protein R2706_05340 [Acidimicrobiales bacterium]